MEAVPGTSLELQRITIHGHERAYVKIGEGPALLLLHGLGCDHTTWLPVIADLARHYTVIAPDLLGHGVSAKPRADYSVGGYANGMRDLLTVLEHRQGHRGRAQLRRRHRDAVRLPVPRAHRADDPGRAGRPRPRGDARSSARSRCRASTRRWAWRRCPASATSARPASARCPAHG